MSTNEVLKKSSIQAIIKSFNSAIEQLQTSDNQIVSAINEAAQLGPVTFQRGFVGDTAITSKPTTSGTTEGDISWYIKEGEKFQLIKLTSGAWVDFATITDSISKSDLLIVSAFSNTESALDLYLSADGKNFNKLNKEPLYRPVSGVLRDPSIIKRGDYYYIVYSAVPSDANFNTSKYEVIKSRNLKDWELVGEFDWLSFHGSFSQGVWAPEWFVDDDDKVYVIVAFDFITYIIEHTGNELETAGTPINLSPAGINGSNYIDGTIIKEDGDYVMFIKNEDTKFIERFQSNSLLSGYTKTGTGDWAGWGASVEGPCIIRLSDNSVRIYLDAYASAQYFYSSSASAKSNTWTTKQQLPIQSGKIRHFTAKKITDKNTVNIATAAADKFASIVVSEGSVPQAESVYGRATSPLNNTFQRYQCDEDYAVFQARKLSTLEGIDFVYRPTSNYGAIEFDTNEIVRFHQTDNRAEFPQGIRVGVYLTPDPLLNGWAFGSEPLRYIHTNEGIITFEGIVSGGTTTPLTVIFNLPELYRPRKNLVFPVVDNDTSIGTVGIQPNGNVVILSGSNTKLDLSSIMFTTR